METDKCPMCTQTLPTEAVIVKRQTPFTCPDCGQIEFPYQPLKNIAFIFPDPLPEKLGSFYLPSMYAENHRNRFGTVLAIGKGYTNKHGKRYVTTARPGDRVVYDKDVPWYMMIMAPDGKKYHIKYMPELDIKGIVEEEDVEGIAGGDSKATPKKAV